MSNGIRDKEDTKFANIHSMMRDGEISENVKNFLTNIGVSEEKTCLREGCKVQPAGVCNDKVVDMEPNRDKYIPKVKRTFFVLCIQSMGMGSWDICMPQQTWENEDGNGLTITVWCTITTLPFPACCY